MKKLEIFAARGNLAEVKRLVENGAHIHPGKYKSLRLAAGNGHINVVEYLLDIGADIHAQGDYALILAAENMNMEMVKFLVARGANVQKCGGFTVMNSIARAGCNFPIIKYLIDQGMQIDDIILLEITARNNDVDTVKYLIDKGVDVNMIGGTTWFYIYIRDHINMLKLLIKSGFKLDGHIVSQILRFGSQIFRFLNNGGYFSGRKDIYDIFDELVRYKSFSGDREYLKYVDNFTYLLKIFPEFDMKRITAISEYVNYHKLLMVCTMEQADAIGRLRQWFVLRRLVRQKILNFRYDYVLPKKHRAPPEMSPRVQTRDGYIEWLRTGSKSFAQDFWPLLLGMGYDFGPLPEEFI